MKRDSGFGIRVSKPVGSGFRLRVKLRRTAVALAKAVSRTIMTAVAAIAIPISQYKTVPCFTNKFPSDLLDAILGSSVKSINYALLFFGCVLFHITGTWSLPLIDRDEPRFAEASREMIERADYGVPYFNNQLRLDKPPLAYWAQVVSYHIFGENDFAARFPSVAAAALTALAIFAWGLLGFAVYSALDARYRKV